jgi:Holliday junction resolvase RusA-like endonuclease
VQGDRPTTRPGVLLSAPVSFTVHGVAQPAGSKRGFYNKNSGRVIITDDATKSRPWKALVSDAAIQAMATQEPDSEGKLLDGPLLLELTFWMPRPKGHYGSGKNAGKIRGSAPRFPTVKPDLLKLARAVEDALTGIVYRDDAQIATEVLQKAYGEPARVEVRVVPIRQDIVETQHRPLRGEPEGAAATQLPLAPEKEKAA